jgi:Tol biopolymer transport system component
MMNNPFRVRSKKLSKTVTLTLTAMAIAFGSIFALPSNAQRSSIAFRGTDIDDENDQIWVVDSRGSEPTSLTKHFGTGVDTADPGWSPDGEWIAFVLATDFRAKDLWIMRSNGTEASELVRESTRDDDSATLQEPSWSPDGSRIVYIDSPPSRIHFVDPVNAAKTFVSTTSDFRSHPDWTPDGQHIVFSGFSGVYIASADGGDVQLLVDDAEDGRDHGHPTVSPDGTRIAFEVFSPPAIWLMNIDGSNQRLLMIDGEAPCWSPDSQQIAFASGESDIRVINADGTGPHTILESETIRNIGELAWSPFLDEDTVVLPVTWGAVKHPRADISPRRIRTIRARYSRQAKLGKGG